MSGKTPDMRGESNGGENPLTAAHTSDPIADAIPATTQDSQPDENNHPSSTGVNFDHRVQYLSGDSTTSSITDTHENKGVHYGHRRQSIVQQIHDIVSPVNKHDKSQHQMLVTLDHLEQTEDQGYYWQEKARWIKYEENYEAATGRWGLPHVSSLSFHSFFELKQAVEDGVVLLDSEHEDFACIVDSLVDILANDGILPKSQVEDLCDILFLKHRHVKKSHPKTRRSQSLRLRSSARSRGTDGSRSSARSRGTTDPPEIRRIGSEPVIAAYGQSLGHINPVYEADHKTVGNGDAYDENCNCTKSGITMGNLQNKQHTVTIVEAAEDGKKAAGEESDDGERPLYLAVGAEAAIVLVGQVDFLEKQVCVFVRLAQPQQLQPLTIDQVPVRFVFILLGGKSETNYFQMGRAMSTILNTHEFQLCAREASSKEALLTGISTFLDNAMVLPAGDWTLDTLLPLLLTARKKARAIRSQSTTEPSTEEMSKLKMIAGDDSLTRTGCPFGGMVRDIRKRYPLYWSDIKDGFNMQCLATYFFIFFACLAPAITFGGLMSNKVQDWIGVSETLLATSVLGIFFGIFSAQPIKIIGVTGPMLLFEESLFQICELLELEYISVRVWVFVWIGVITIVTVACEASVLVRLFSRFTEEIFASLISLLFIYETFFKLYQIFRDYPVYTPGKTGSESFVIGNDTNLTALLTTTTTSMPSTEITEAAETTLPPYLDVEHHPNVALLSFILTLGTFGIAWYLKGFRNSKYLGRTMRRALGDFGVPIAIMVMVGIDIYFHDTATEKLHVPDGLAPTDATKRGWLINPMGMEKELPIWAIFAAIIPALLGFILIFMESQITGVIINKPDRNLKKGSGYHLDIMIIGCFMVVNGFLGLPMMCAAAVRSISHVNALQVFSRTAAPGERPRLVHVHEQRVTAVLVHVTIALTVLMGPVLRYVPLAVLFGVFLYMGVASMNGVQLFERLEMVFMPVKHHCVQEDYVRKVRTWKMHAFTAIQVTCLAVLWIVKSTQAALAFPFVLILTVPVRRYLLPCLFTHKELAALDNSGQTVAASPAAGDSDVVDVDDELAAMADMDFYEEAHMANALRRTSVIRT